MVMTYAPVVVVLLQFVGQLCTAVQAPVCQPQASCSECLSSPGCAWCKQQDFLKQGESTERRCDSFESLKNRECRDVVNPVASVFITKNNNLNSKIEDVVQLKPQGIEIKLRIGVPQEFKVEFQRAEGYPIDLYYLMDLSYSMKDDLENIKNLGQDILKELQKVTQSVRIGFGSFVDKDKLPYVSQVKSRHQNPCPNRLDTCEPAFTFKNVLPLTGDAREFKKNVSAQKISGNLDSPEAGLDAIMQAAVCQKEIGWRDVTRILVYTSDDTFHIAGDGRLAGIFQPHDGQCHLSSYGFYDGTVFDYPSIGHLSRVLQANSIQLIFAVTKDSVPAYEALSALIPQSVVAELKKDSSNVVRLIADAYGNLTSTLHLEQDRTPAGLHISYMSYCSPGVPSEWQHKGECTGIKVNEKVEFKVRLNASECLKKPEIFEIRMHGIKEVLKVTVETLCDCNCKDKQENSEVCKGQGTLSCGVCSCNEGHLGQHCECKRQSDMNSTHAMLKYCRPQETSQVCSGHGSCECGQCICSGHFRGNFCQCDDASCERHNNKVCNGQGRCECDTCICNANYTGTACQCSTDTTVCLNKNGKKCSGHGECECNQCKCKDGFGGKDCSQLLKPCSTYQPCVDCTVKAELYGRSTDNCSLVCESAKLTRLKGNHQLQCLHEDVVYDVTQNSDGTVLIQYADLPRSIDKTAVIIGTSVSAIVLIGIAIIIVYKVLLELYDLREYRSFLKAQEQTDWKETQNPLFQGATTTVLNPLHSQDS
ncbi:integrin beta-7-like isoform X3 [Colossoma macropomum]|uniref:integrin beta-7-like isoform X3 n=1 Tax=Colossoma macropomum TaxID=42526 RepID=UPI0018644A2C|nr:integrin beta-7-like isoform X3 [Colossoma macropomum]